MKPALPHRRKAEGLDSLLRRLADGKPVKCSPASGSSRLRRTRTPERARVKTYKEE